MTKYKNYEHAFYDISEGIRKAVEEILQRRQPIVPLKVRQPDYPKDADHNDIEKRLRKLLGGDDDIEDDDNDYYYHPPSYESSIPWSDWRFITIIASVVFGAILMFGSQNLSIRKLHDAARVWDVNSARQAIAELKLSGDTCKSQLGNSVEEILNKHGSQGLNMVQGMQTHLEKTTTCKYPSVFNAPNQIPYEMLKFN